MTTSPTQGEHAQPESLQDFEVRKLAAIGAVSTSSGLVERRPIEYRRELEDQFVRGFRAAEKRLHAQVAALTAAPQGGAYAGLPTLFREALAWGMTYGPEIPAHQWDEMRESMVKQYTERASHGQAPAQVAPSVGTIGHIGDGPTTLTAAVAPLLAAQVAPAAVAGPAKTSSIFALRTEPEKGESQWAGIYSSRVDAEHDAEVMCSATGREWHVVTLAEASSVTVHSTTTEAAAHEWQVSHTYGGEICANCGAVKGTRRGNTPCGEAAAPTQAAPAAVAGPSDEAAIERTRDLAEAGGRWPSDWVEAYRRGYSDRAARAPADSVLEDAARYRFLAAHCRSTSEHWGGRWSIIVDGPAPKSHDSEDDFDTAIDAARKQGANHE